MEPEQTDENILHAWSIPGHEERERTGRFYFWFFAIFIVLLVFSVWQESFLFSIFILLAAGTILFLSGQRADIYEFTFTDTHFIIGEHESSYEYSSMSHFDIYSFSDTDRELFLVFKEKFRPMLRIRYYKGDEEKIRDILFSKNIPQRKIEPSILDIFSKIVGI